MKRRFRSILAFTLCLMMILGNIAVGGEVFSLKASAIEYQTGDTIEFGMYPQTKVTDSSTVSALNSKASKWISYKYYEANASGKTQESDYMYYCDVTYGGNKYRGVKFNTYRPYWTTDASTTVCSTYQNSNGYTTGNTYWFKYEPIKWRVLDPSTGLVLSEKILDSQAYNNYILESGKDEYGKTACWGNSAKTYYANSYADSSIRQWLHNGFYNAAFSSSEQDKIQSATLNNSAYSTSYSAYGSGSTKDKVFLLSYAETQKTAYGYTNSTSSTNTRTAKGSDYAKCQGLYVNSGNGNSPWRLSSAGSSSDGACTISYDGSVGTGFQTYATGIGVRAAIKLKLNSETKPETSSTYSIRNMEKYNGQTIDYRASLTIYADVQNCTDVTWVVTGAQCTINDDRSVTINQAKGDFSVYFTAKDLKGNEVKSETESVKVNTGFFAQFAAFFKGLFKKLPDLQQ